MRSIFPAHLQNDHGGGIFTAFALGALNIDIIDRGFLPPDGVQDIVKVLDRGKFHIDRHVAQFSLKRALHRIHDIQNDEQDDQHEDHTVIHACAGRHAHTYGGKQAGCSSQSGDLLVTGGKDRAGCQETDAADDLGGIAGRVKFHADFRDDRGPLAGHHLVFIEGEKDRHTSADRGQHVGAKTCVLFLAGSSVADHTAAGHGQQKPHQDGDKIKFMQKSKCRAHSIPLFDETDKPGLLSSGCPAGRVKDRAELCKISKETLK